MNDNDATAPRSALGTPAPQRAPRWVAFATLGACALVPIVLGVLGYVQHGEMVLARQEAARAHEELRADMDRHAKLATAFRRVSGAEISTSCSGLNGEMECTFTNTSTDFVTVCVTGKVNNKQSPGVSLSSMVLCSGRLEPLATRRLSVPWQRGRAVDLCNSPGYGGTKQLDWDQCEFNYDDSPTAGGQTSASAVAKIAAPVASAPPAPPVAKPAAARASSAAPSSEWTEVR